MTTATQYEEDRHGEEPFANLEAGADRTAEGFRYSSSVDDVDGDAPYDAYTPDGTRPPASVEVYREMLEAPFIDDAFEEFLEDRIADLTR